MLHIIRADAGCDKSGFLTGLFANEAACHPQVNYVYIVPEQFTMSTQTKMVKASTAGAIMNIDVLSFNRLAYRVFTELGTPLNDVLMETGKSLLIRRVAQEKADELDVLKGNMRKPGYIAQMKSLISELTQYRKTPEDLQNLIENNNIPENFRHKAHDLMVMYEGFLTAKQDKYITAEELLDKLLEVIDDSCLLKGAVIAFDGFTGFTPLQRALLEKILPMAAEVYVTITIADGEIFTGKYDELSLFAMSRKMKKDLDEICQRHGMEEEIVSLSGTFTNHQPGGYLDHLQKCIFQTNQVRTRDSGELLAATDRIRIVRANNPRGEVKYVASEIRRLISEEGYRYKDIAVVSASLADYQYHILDIFKEAKISVFLDFVRPVLVNPALEYLRSFMEIALSDFSYESVMKYLRCGLSDISEKEADLLENYILACGIRGSMYLKEFTFVVAGTDEDALAASNRTRQKLIDELSHTIAFEKEETVLSYCKKAFLQMQENHIEEKIRQRARAYEDANDHEKAQEYLKTYAGLIDILEKTAAILGQERVTLEEFNELLEAGLEEVKLAVIPPDYDSVTVGDIERTRLEEIRALFLIGATDDLIPKKEEHGGLLSQMDRQMLFDYDIELAPTDRQRQAMQRFYLYMLMARPSEALYLTYGNVNMAGEGVTESYLVHRIEDLYDDVRETPNLNAEEKSLDLGLSYVRYYLADHLRDYLSGKYITEEQEEMLCALKLDMEEDNSMELRKWKKAITEIRKPELITPLHINGLIGKEVPANAYNMECYSKCPYEYFLSYLLRLKERDVYAVTSADLGTLYHGVLESYSDRLNRSEYDWKNVPDEISNQLLDDAIADAMKTFSKRGLDSNPREKYIFDRAKKTLTRTIWAVKEQVRAGSFQPCRFELSFDQHTSVSRLSDQFDLDFPLCFSGKVDRIDAFRHEDTVYVKIVDYKSSETKLDNQLIQNGLQMQLIVYMNNAIDYMADRNFEKQILPGAMFYYHIDDPYLEEALDTDQERLKELKPEGLFNDDPVVVKALDLQSDGEGAYKSVYIPFERKKDGSASKASKGISTEEFQNYLNLVKEQIAANVVSICSGHIEAYPYRLGKDTACSKYCNYKSICGFEEAVAGCRYRELNGNKDDE